MLFFIFDIAEETMVEFTYETPSSSLLRLSRNIAVAVFPDEQRYNEVKTTLGVS
jgi:hypothetical protein